MAQTSYFSFISKDLRLLLKNTLNRLICHLCTQKQCMAVTIITEIVCPKRIHWKEECSHLHGALNIIMVYCFCGTNELASRKSRLFFQTIKSR